MQKTKMCKECKIEKSILDFHKKGSSFRSYCKDCSSLKNKLKHQEKRSVEKTFIESKVCIKCGESKNRIEFGEFKASKDGLSNKCKKCISNYRKSDNMVNY